MHRLFRENKIILLLSLAGAVGFVIDRVLKHEALQLEAGSIPIIGEWARFSLFMNDAMAFSLPVSVEIMRLVSVVIFLVVAYLAFRTYRVSQAQTGALIVVLFGAMSNLIDRFYHGFVIDYVDLWSYSMFNLADILIGVGLLAVLIIRPEKKKK